MSAVLKLHNIHRSYRAGEQRLQILQGFNLEVAPGEIVALVGPSGCGKTTLLQIAGLLDRPDSGEIWIDGREASALTEAERTKMRLSKLGFVYQFHHLLPEFSALENVAMPLLIAGQPKAKAQQTAAALLERFGLSHRLNHRPGELSGGEQQRVAIARALSHRPALLLADEPTGNLDPETAQSVFALFLDFARESGLSMLMVTHNPELAAKADRQISVIKKISA